MAQVLYFTDLTAEKRESRRLENLDGHPSDHVFDRLPVGFHVGGDQVRFQGIEIRPFLDNDNGAFPDRFLDRDACGKIDGGTVFYAPLLGPDMGNQFMKLFQKLRPFAFGDVNGGNNMDHVVLLSWVIDHPNMLLNRQTGQTAT
jgi:hypothetical protein